MHGGFAFMAVVAGALYCFPAMFSFTVLLPVCNSWVPLCFSTWLHTIQILVKEQLCLEFLCPWLPPTWLPQSILSRLLQATHRCQVWPLWADHPLVYLFLFHQNCQPSCPKQFRPWSSLILLLHRHNQCHLVPPFQPCQLHLPLLGVFPLHWAPWLLELWHWVPYKYCSHTR